MTKGPLQFCSSSVHYHSEWNLICVSLKSLICSNKSNPVRWTVSVLHYSIFCLIWKWFEGLPIHLKSLTGYHLIIPLVSSTFSPPPSKSLIWSTELHIFTSKAKVIVHLLLLPPCQGTGLPQPWHFSVLPYNLSFYTHYCDFVICVVFYLFISHSSYFNLLCFYLSSSSYLNYHFCLYQY